MTEADGRPLVLTAELDEQTFAWLDGLRRVHFPPERNHLGAHLTLFHALPAAELTRIDADLRTAAADLEPIDGVAQRWMLLGRGVAMAIEAPGLAALRRRLARGWRETLTEQDGSGFRAHVTIQNKVAPSDAKDLAAELIAGHAPRRLTIPALRLWRYAGGPWEPEAIYPLTGRDRRRAEDRPDAR